MIPIPDIRERNDRPKDKQPKHQAASTVQHQMVLKFVKELNNSTKQSEQPSNAERAATEQVETTAREIVHEAVQLPCRAIQYSAHRRSEDSSVGVKPERFDQPHQRAEVPRTRQESRQPQSVPTPVPQDQARRAYVQQVVRDAASATSEQLWECQGSPSASLTENTLRQRTDDVRTRPEPQHPQSASAAVPQEQTRRAYVQQAAKKFTTAPPIIPEQSQPQYPTVSASLAENAPRQRADDLRTRPKPKQPQSIPTSTPQEQGRRAYVRQAKKSRAEKPSARDHLHTEQPEIRLVDSAPQKEVPAIREKPKAPEIRSQVHSKTTPAKPSTVRHEKQPDAWTPRSPAAPVMRGKEQSIRERSAVTQARDLSPTPQEQARQAFMEKQAQLTQNPSIESIYPSEPAAPIPPKPSVSEAPTITPERQPVTASSGKLAPSVRPPTPAQTPPEEQPSAIREKPKPNTAPREKSQRGVDIRTRDTEQISAPKAQSKTPASKTATKRARKAVTQDAQRKMLQKSNNRAARAAAAAAKKLAEAAAKAVKELISALASLGGGTALFIVFSIVIVAGAFLASPLGILFTDEQQADNTVPLATAIAEIQGEYHAELERLQNGDFVSVQIVGQAPDWREVVAVFASKTAGAEDGIDVFTLDEERVELLRQVFWDMCEITTATQTVDVPDSDPDDDVDDSHTGIALTITITAKTAEQMRLIYAFTKYQNDALDILLENLGSLNIPMGSLTISQEDAIALLENLPDDLDPARKAVVETAVQLVGRVSYFWGGKSLTLGWDDRWGVPTEVTAAGSGSTGTVRPFGLDCSGFVDWTFYNATNGSYYPGHGGGAATQHSYCTNISWNDAQPGDLVFYPDDSHVGIVGGKDADGNLLIVHCSGGANGVVITGSAGFTVVARPDCFTN